MTFLRYFGRVLAAAMALLPLCAAPALAATIDTAARYAFLKDMTNDTVLLDKNADERMPTSSMSKMMTLYVVFKAIKEGRLKLTDTLPVSEKAWRMQGSKTYVELNNQVSVEDLIRGVAVQSGNDATIVLAEGISGSEEAFAEELNRVAKQIGMTNSNFVNASGWPDPNHYSTARDLALLAERTIKDFPELYRYYAEKEFTYHKIKQGNRNPLLYKKIGADGLKTGHTEQAGYGLTASAERNGRRLILVVNGLTSINQRSEESERLMEWGYREFAVYTLFKPGEVVDHAPVWMGTVSPLPLVFPDGLNVTMNRQERQGLQVKLVVEQPIPAPVKKGNPVGKVVITAPGFAGKETPIYAGADSERAGIVGRLYATAKYHALGMF